MNVFSLGLFSFHKEGSFIRREKDGVGRWSRIKSIFLLADGILELKRRAGLDI